MNLHIESKLSSSPGNEINFNKTSWGFSCRLNQSRNAKFDVIMKILIIAVSLYALAVILSAISANRLLTYHPSGAGRHANDYDRLLCKKIIRLSTHAITASDLCSFLIWRRLLWALCPWLNLLWPTPPHILILLATPPPPPTFELIFLALSLAAVSVWCNIDLFVSGDVWPSSLACSRSKYS